MSSKEKFCNSSTNRKISDKENGHLLNVRNKFEMKTMNYYRDLYLKCDLLLLADVFGKHRNDSLKKFWIVSKPLFERTRFKLGCNA